MVQNKERAVHTAGKMVVYTAFVVILWVRFADICCVMAYSVISMQCNGYIPALQQLY